MVCPNCGQAVCYGCLKIRKDSKRYGRVIPAYKKYPLGNKGPWKVRSRKKSRARRKQIDRPIDPGKDRSKSEWQVQLPEYPLQADALKYQRRGVNYFLEDIYRPGLHISDILKRRGFSESQIEDVKNEVARYLVLLVAAWCNRWRSMFTSRQIYIVADFYSFNGQISEGKSNLAQRLQIPIEGIMDELNVVLQRLRCQHEKQIEQLIVDTATRI